MNREASIQKLFDHAEKLLSKVSSLEKENKILKDKLNAAEIRLSKYEPNFDGLPPYVGWIRRLLP